MLTKLVTKLHPSCGNQNVFIETMALAEAADAGYSLAQITKEIFNLKKKLKIVCNTDSESLVIICSIQK